MESTLKDKEVVGCGQHGRLNIRQSTEVTTLDFKIFRKQGMQSRESIQKSTRASRTEQSMYEHVVLLQYFVNFSL